MRSSGYSYAHTHQRRSPGLCAFVSLAKFLIVVGLLLAVGWLFFQNTVRTKLTGKVEEKINADIAAMGLIAKLAQATFVEGQGVTLKDLRLAWRKDRFDRRVNANAADLEELGDLPGLSIDGAVTVAGNAVATSQRHLDDSEALLAEFYDAFIHLPVSTTDLISGNPRPLRIEIRRARLNIAQNQDGVWPLVEAIAAFRGTPKAELIPIHISDSEIRIVERTHSSPRTHRLTDVQIDFQPVVHEGRSLHQLVLQCANGDVGSFQISILCDPVTRQFDAHIVTQRIRLSPALLALLPADLAHQTASVKSLNGELSIEGRVSGGMDQGISQLALRGDVQHFSFDDERLPAAITRAHARFLVTDDSVRFADVQGRFGESDFSGDYFQHGLLQRRDWIASGNMRSLDFEYAIAMTHMMPGGCKQFCNDFSPRGQCDIDFKVGHDGQRPIKRVHADLRDTSFTFVRFPYYVDQCSGTVDLVDATATLDMRSNATTEPMTMKGVIRNPGIDATYAIDIAAPVGIPIDQRLLKAMDALPAMGRVARDFRPTGRLGGTGRIVKSVPRGNADKHFEVELNDVAIRHVAFPYPIRNIQGTIKADNFDFEFHELTGGNGNGTIFADGIWNPRSGLATYFRCENVNMDEQLRMAFSPDLQEIWQGFRPRGSVDRMAVQMNMPIGHDFVNVVVDADLANAEGQSSISIFPTWFPYEIKHLAGNVKIGNGRIDVSSIQGHHDRTWLACEGAGEYSDEAWSVTLRDLLATSLKVDEDLLAALPTTLAPPIRQMKYEGLMNVNGELTIAGALEKNSTATGVAAGGQDGAFNNGYAGGTAAAFDPLEQNRYLSLEPTMAWDLDFVMNNAKMLIGLPVESVFGTVNLRGTYDGQRAQCDGELAIDSLTIYDAQITDITGPVLLDNDRIAAGTLAARQQDKNNISPLVDNVASLGQRSLEGNLYDGVVKFDATMQNDSEGKFYIQTVVDDANIRDAGRDFASGIEDLEGRGFLNMRMGGDYADFHSYKGDGTVKVRDAKIYELPAMLTLLKMLHVGRTDRTAFDSSNVNFLINGNDIDFERIELNGDAISLIGNGRMNLDQDIDLNFYSIVGRNRVRIPVLNELVHVGSQQILWISVDGTIDNPRMHRQVLPQLNDTLKQLFRTPGNDATEPIGNEWSDIDQLERTADRSGGTSMGARLRRSFLR